MGKRKVSIFSVLVFIIALSGLGLGAFSLYNYQQLVIQLEQPKPLARAFLTTSYSTTNGLWLKVDFDVIEYDVSGDFNILTDRFICPTSGYYLISGKVTFSSMQDGEVINIAAFSEGVREAGSVTHAAHANIVSVGFTDIVHLNAGDYVELSAYHSGSAARTIYGSTAGTYTYFTIAFLN